MILHCLLAELIQCANIRKVVLLESGVFIEALRSAVESEQPVDSRVVNCAVLQV